MILLSLDGVNKMEPNTGLLETLGEHTGVKEEISDLSEVLIILEFKVPAYGPLQSIPGPKIFEMKPNLLLKRLNQSSILLLIKTNVKEFHQKQFKKMLSRQDLTNI